MKKIYSSIIIVLLLLSLSSSGQDKDNKGLFSWLPKGVTLSAYFDGYISYDNDKGDTLRKFSTAAPYRNEFRVNLVMGALRYEAKHVRGNLAIQFGDIPLLNWPQTPNKYIKYVQEANAGISPRRGVWLDAGYFLTHIGAEGIIPKDNFFQTMALCSYFQPFFQSGVQLSYTGKKFYGAAMVLHGYNLFTDNNKNKSLAIQLGYIPNKYAEITYNNIIGNEMPEGTPGKTRIYNDLVVKISPAKKLEMILCGDFCLQEKSKLTDSNASANMFSGFLSMRYKAAKRVYLSLRGEIYQDKDGIMSGVFENSDSVLSGLKAFGVTAGVEYDPKKNVYFRLEGRYLMTDSKQKIFFNSENSRVESVLSAGIGF